MIILLISENLFQLWYQSTYGKNQMVWDASKDLQEIRLFQQANQVYQHCKISVSFALVPLNHDNISSYWWNYHVDLWKFSKVFIWRTDCLHSPQNWHFSVVWLKHWIDSSFIISNMNRTDIISWTVWDITTKKTSFCRKW